MRLFALVPVPLQKSIVKKCVGSFFDCARVSRVPRECMNKLGTLQLLNRVDFHDRRLPHWSFDA